MNTLTHRNLALVLAGAACVGVLAAATYGDPAVRLCFAVGVVMLWLGVWGLVW